MPDVFRTQSGQVACELALQYGHGFSTLSLLQRLTDTDNHVQTGGKGTTHFPANERIVLAELEPALTVADDHVTTAQVEQHVDADFPSVSAFLLRVDILGAQRDRGASHHF